MNTCFCFSKKMSTYTTVLNKQTEIKMKEKKTHKKHTKNIQKTRLLNYLLFLLFFLFFLFSKIVLDLNKTKKEKKLPPPPQLT